MNAISNMINPGKPDPAMTNYGGFGGQMQPQAMPQNTGIVPPQMQGMDRGGFGQGFGGGQFMQNHPNFAQRFGQGFGQGQGGFGFGQGFGGMGGGGFQMNQGFGGGGSVAQNMGTNGAPDFPPQYGVR